MVRLEESTPLGYFVALHVWIQHVTAISETGARSLSALAGIALVVATWWTARAVVGRRAALASAGLVLLSPQVLIYAQQARCYVFVMLAAVLAVGAALRGRLVLSVLAVLAAVWLHYSALLVAAGLCLYVWRTDRRRRVRYVAAVAVSVASVLPLMIAQYRANPTGGVGAPLTLENLVRVLGAPFEARGTLTALVPALGGLLVIAGGILLWRRSRLVAGLALAAPAAITLLALAGKDILIPRYIAVATPFALIALTQLPRPAFALLAVALAFGVVADNGASGRYAPAREAIAYIRSDLRPGDAVTVPYDSTVQLPLAYYAEPRPALAPSPATAFDGRRRVWVVAADAPAGQDVVRASAAGLARLGYRPARGRVFATSRTLAVILAVPQAAR